jgi:ADP-ribose pyrophosphatase
VIDENESNEDAISREIIEEVGYQVDHLDFVTKCYLSPGGSTEKIGIYIAFVSNKIGKGGGLDHEGEQIETVKFSINELLAYPFEDAKTIITIEYIKNNWPLYEK